MSNWLTRQARKVGNVVSDYAIDPMRSVGRGLVGGVGDAWDAASGASATQKALNQQMQASDRAGQAMNQGYDQAQGMIEPFNAGSLQNYQDYGDMIRNNSFSPQFQGYQGSMSSGGQFDPQFQAYQGPMSSGNQLPQYQQFQGPSQFQAGARPNRMAGTTDNVNMYMDPGYKFRLEQGLNAVQSSAAARGLLGSSATLNNINEYAQGLASQEFGAAHNRFMGDQDRRHGDFQWDQNFGMNNFNQNFQNQRGILNDQNTWNANNADRAQNWFEGDRAAGMQNNQFQNNFGLQQANFRQGAFEGDRAAGLNQNQFQNNFNMQNAQNNQNAWQGLVNTGMGVNDQLANLALSRGQTAADIYMNQGNARGAATLAQSNQRRGLFGDAVNTGFRAWEGR